MLRVRSLLKNPCQSGLLISKILRPPVHLNSVNFKIRCLSTQRLNYLADTKQYKLDDTISGFLVKEILDVEELHLSCVRLEHQKTGADYLHVLRDDTNNVFSVAFRTPPPNSTGTCHILEHLALCGSQTYPCRDPFFKMLNRSAATFMNAFTGSDYTMYPFSTQNYKDFNNLLHVYLDAAFFPLLIEKDFCQEGWRLEHKDIEDSSTPIILKGVVFNEMKAMHSSSAYTFYEHLLNKILPSHAYRFVSGGDPLEIPNLTWQQLKEYHSKYYHPSNARFFSYGTFPLQSHLSKLDNWILSKFDRRSVDSSILLEPLWNQPRQEKFHCFPDPVAPNPEKQTTYAQTYLLDKINDSYESFSLAILSTLLVDGASSPFYKSLLLSGLGADYSPGTGYDGNNQQSFFSIGLTGIDEKDVEKVSALIENTFQQVINDGFHEERIEAVLHAVELGFKHQTKNFGLSLVMALNSFWNHGGNPIDALQINNHINWFKDQLVKDPSYLQKKVAQYFRENTHKLSLTMNPDASRVKEFEVKEQEILEHKLECLTEADRAKIFQDGKELAKHQRDSAQVFDLPTLTSSELNPRIETVAVNVQELNGIPVFSVCAPTNGVMYFRSVLKTDHLPENLKPYLNLFCNVLTKMGAAKLNFMEQDHKIMLHTGGLSASVHLSDHSNGHLEEGILLQSHCLNRNTEEMFSLWRDIFCELKLEDKERLGQLILENSSELVQNLSHVAHSYAIRRANCKLNKVGSLTELHHGLSHVSHLKELARLTNYTEVIEKFQDVARLVLNTDRMRCAIHTAPEFENQYQMQLGTFLTSLPTCGTASSKNSLDDKFSYEQNQTHFVMPFPVNYVAKGQPTVYYTHPDYATLKVIARLVSAKYLHREIREVGGAYGSGVTLNDSGIWTYYSYRDPNVENTLNAFSKSNNWLTTGQFSEQDVDEAKLQVLCEMDKPIPPGSKGLDLFLNGVDDAFRQKYRDTVFAVTRDSILGASNKYLSGNKQFGVTVLGPENSFTSKGSWNLISEM